MPRQITIPIGGGLSSSPSEAISNSVLKNLMPYSSPVPGASTGTGLVPTFGINRWGVGDLPYGNQFKIKGLLYVVSGDTIYHIDKNGNKSTAATCSTNISFSTDNWAFNGEVVCLGSRSGSYYFWDMSGSTVTEITDVVFQGHQAVDNGVLNVTSGDGYFIYDTEDDVFISTLVSDASKGTNFNASDTAVAEFKPDKNSLVKWFQGELVVFGQYTSEVWANVGGADFPFARIEGATIEKGLGDAGSSSLQEINNTLVFTGYGAAEDPAVWQWQLGGQPIRLSNPYIESLFRENGGNSYAFTEQGRSFYGVRVSSINIDDGGIVVIDLTASTIKGYPVWFQWSIDNDSRDFINCYGKVIVSGRYILDPDFYQNYSMLFYGTVGQDENLNYETRVFSSQYLNDQNSDLYVSFIELQAKTGVGSTTSVEADKNPTVLLEVSDDFGRTWTSLGSRSLGTSGDNKKRVVWNRGAGRSPTYRLFRFTTETAVETVFLNLVLHVETALH